MQQTPTFERVQQVLATNNTGGDKSWRYRHYLKGTLRCGHCRDRIGFVHGRDNGGEYEYFYCLGRQRGNGCQQRYIPTWVAEEAVERFYLKVQQRAEAKLPTMRDQFRQLLASQRDVANKEADSLQRQRARFEREQRKLLQLAYDDELPDPIVKDDSEESASNLKKLTGN